MRSSLVILLCLTSLFASDFAEEESAWRKERETRLKSEDGWLNLAGLFWLKEGQFTFGTSDQADIVLPKHSTVGIAGTLTVKEDGVHFKMKRAQAAFLNGEWSKEGVLRLPSDDLEKPDLLAHNNLRLFLIQRGDDLGLRVRDLRAEAVRLFRGIEYFPARKTYEVEAQLERFEEAKKVFVPNELGTETILESPGVLKFQLKKKDLQLLAISSGKDDSKLFLMFTDKTTGIDTYLSGRYLYATKTGEDTYQLNFNRAVNPPCAFTPFATCPYPPDENTLDMEIKAGEKIYKYDDTSSAEKESK